MFLAYMDESGNTGTRVDPAQPIHLIGCLVVEDVAVRPLEDAIDAVAVKYFAPQRLDPRFEFHGKELHDGKGLFKGVAAADRLAAATEVINAVKQHATVWGYAGVNKLKSAANDHRTASRSPSWSSAFRSGLRLATHSASSWQTRTMRSANG